MTLKLVFPDAEVTIDKKFGFDNFSLIKNFFEQEDNISVLNIARNKSSDLIELCDYLGDKSGRTKIGADAINLAMFLGLDFKIIEIYINHIELDFFESIVNDLDLIIIERIIWEDMYEFFEIILFHRWNDVVLPPTVDSINQFILYREDLSDEILLNNILIVDNSVEITSIDYLESKLEAESFTGEHKFDNRRPFIRVVVCGENIDPYFLYDCVTLLRVITMREVKNIGSNFLSDCVGLRELVMADGILKIGDGFCNNCFELEDLYIPETVQSIGKKFLSGCRSLNELIFHGESPIQHIPDNFAKGCVSLRQIIIPIGIAIIGDNFGWCCFSLGYLELSEELRMIGKRFLEDCPALKRVIIPRGVMRIGENFLGSKGSLTVTHLEILIMPNRFRESLLSLMGRKNTIIERIDFM